MAHGVWPVAVGSLGRVACGTAVWRFGGQTMVTAVAKASFVFMPDGPMRVRAPERLHVSDAHLDGDPLRSLSHPREMAPMLRKADVLLQGRAYASAGGGAAAVRLRLVQGAQTPLDKTLHVYGDRDAGGAPSSFIAIDLRHERAFGGIGCSDNPIGRGKDEDDPPANIFYPNDPERSATFGAIPSVFPCRKQLLRGESRKQIEGLDATLPDDMDWSYFQSAPHDQQVDRLAADAWVMLEGVRPDDERIRTQLPSATLRCKVYAPAEAGAPSDVPMQLDMLQLDAEAQRATLIWRGSFPVLDEAALATLKIGCALELPGETTMWPIDASQLEAPLPPAGQGGPMSGGGDFASTMALDRTADPASNRAHALPFENTVDGFEATVSVTPDARPPATPFDRGPSTPPSSPPSGPRPALPGAPWATSQPAAVPVASPGVRSTLVVEDSTELAQQVAVLAAQRAADRKAEEAAAAQRAAAEREAAQLAAEQAAAKAAEEASARAAAEEAARIAAEKAAADKAAAAQAAEAERRREEAAARFKREQQEAERAAAQRAAEERASKQAATEALRANIYSGFRRKR